MKKLMTMLIATTFSAASVGAFAMSHGGAMSDADKAKKLEACKKMIEVDRRKDEGRLQEADGRGASAPAKK